MTVTANTWEMYVPQAYRAPDPEFIIRTYAFGQIVTAPQGLPYATSVPMYLEECPEGGSILFGHMARQNPQARTMSAGQKALATFHGPDAYISASWYKDRPTVPTWNYIAAQVRGTLFPVDEDEEQLAIMRDTIARSEASIGSSWVMEHAPDGKVETLLPQIRSFRLNVERVDGVTKLSQKNPPADQDRVIDALENLADVHQHEIAKHMRELRQKGTE